MYKTQVYDCEKAESILWRVAKKHHNKQLTIWLYDSKGNLIAYVLADPFEYVTGFKNLSFAQKVIIERNHDICSGYNVYQA